MKHAAFTSYFPFECTFLTRLALFCNWKGQQQNNIDSLEKRALRCRSAYSVEQNRTKPLTLVVNEY